MNAKKICKVLNKAIAEKKEGFEEVVKTTINQMFQDGGDLYYDRELFIDYNGDYNKMKELVFSSNFVEFTPTEDPQEHPGITLRYKKIGHVEKKLSKKDIEKRIAECVGMCYAVKSYKNAITILCDLLYFTNINTKWKDDAVSAIKGVCPEYFKEKTNEA